MNGFTMETFGAAKVAAAAPSSRTKKNKAAKTARYNERISKRATDANMERLVRDITKLARGDRRSCTCASCKVYNATVKPNHEARAVNIVSVFEAVTSGIKYAIGQQDKPESV